MKHFSQHVLIRNQWIKGEFVTEPIEVFWADKALFFIEILETSDKFRALNATVQISPGGITWIDEGTRFENIKEKGLSFRRVSHFGGWLRLKGSLLGENPEARLIIHLVLKE